MHEGLDYLGFDLETGRQVDKLAGWNVLITGASRGIGVHIARALATQETNIARAARSAEPLQELAQEQRERRAAACAGSPRGARAAVNHGTNVK